MIKFKFKSILMTMVASIALSTGVGAISSVSLKVNADSNTVYDLSEWQGRLTDKKAQNLGKEVPFAILRVQYGSSYNDKTFNHNKALLEKYNIPYGVYSFSRYTSSASAANEARNLYNKAPNAKFYVNDFEVASISRKHSNAATAKWVSTLRPLVGSRKILFYSYLSFMQTYAANALSKYDGYWLASYTNSEPSVAHVLWQYTDRHYSSALNMNVDASVLRQQTNWFLGTVSNGLSTGNPTNTSATTNNNQTPAKPMVAKTTQPAKKAKVVKIATKKAKAKKKKKVKKITYHKKRVVKKAKKHVKKHVKKRYVKKVYHKKKHYKKHKA